MQTTSKTTEANLVFYLNKPHKFLLFKGLPVFFLIGICLFSKSAFSTPPPSDFRATLPQALDDSAKAVHNCELGYKYLKAKNTQQSLLAFQAATSASPSCSKAFVGLGDAYVAQGNDQKAIAAYEQAIRLNPENVNAYDGLSLVYMKTWQYEKAALYAEKAIQYQPDLTSAQIRLSMAQFQLRQFQEAFQSMNIAQNLLKETLRHHPDSTDARKALGMAYLISGDWNSALSQYIVLKDQDSVLAAELYQEILSQKAEQELQLEFFESMLHKRDVKKAGRFEANFQLGSAYLRKQEYEKAIEFYKAALEIKPNTVDALNALGVCYLNLERYNEAISVLKLAIDYDPSKPQIYSNLGTAYFSSDRFQDAIAAFEKAVSLNDKLAYPYYGIGISYYSLESKMNMLSSLNASIYVRSGSLGKNANAAKNERFQNIIEPLEHAVKLRPDLASAHFGLGMAYLETGLFGKAIEAFNQAVRFNPEFAQAFAGLGSVYMKLGYKGEAKKALEEAIKLKPEFVDAHLQLGSLFIDEGEYALAIKSFNNITVLNPQNAQAHYLLGQLYIQTNDRAAAMKQLDILDQLSPYLANKLLYALKKRGYLH
ncbi:TPR repeat-containing protein [Chloroherpeton thalassium ATCC 35110]|uniref:TPR repeat-containing protein n=2 Tax=Chloroherpeton thalassium TaxID=100716 RepID=B3QWK2_CHLT3|nr:TPR repeat-containing protein [Chloroherpeton thalassium ATCC 35110]